MTKQILWTQVSLDEFIRLGALTEDEEKIIRSRVKGMTVTQQAREFGMSESSVARIIRRLKDKYDAVQPYSDKLPPRRSSAKEDYMDTH